MGFYPVRCAWLHQRKQRWSGTVQDQRDRASLRSARAYRHSESKTSLQLKPMHGRRQTSMTHADRAAVTHLVDSVCVHVTVLNEPRSNDIHSAAGGDVEWCTTSLCCT